MWIGLYLNYVFFYVPNFHLFISGIYKVFLPVVLSPLQNAALHFSHYVSGITDVIK